MAGITLRTTRQVVPMIYAYTTPEIARHNGWTKIGYTEQAVDKRLKQQTHTADVLFHEEWRGNAVYDDGSGEVFSDHDFHAYLRKLNVENDRKNEWFHVDGEQSRRYFQDFRMNCGRVQLDAAIAYTLRDEQAKAVHDTKTYYESHPGGEYLWNAKPRFGKTLSVYDFCKQIDAQTVFIVTNRPAIANSWYADYVRFLGKESGYLFVSHVDALAGQPHVLDESEFAAAAIQSEDSKRIEFVSLQDMKGAKAFGGEYDKLRHLADIQWDVLVIDEAHEGIDTYKTDLAFDRIHRKFTLHLSGTPFKALASEKFAGDAIFNWTYADEQAAKRNWHGEPGETNPYANLPMLNLYTYQMSEIIRDEVQKGVEIDGQTEEFAFDLNEFFKVKPNGNFEHDAEVDRFLDALTTQNKFPFSTPELRAELKHTFWLLNRVDSARALAKKLQEHPVFGQYEIILAAGDGKLDDTDENQKSFDRVKDAIAHHEKTVTLSVGQLTTGVTIPEWSAVLMLSNLKSPALYMQAAFRAQNPCLFHENGTFRRKENAYVFDFDPARTLLIYEQFANDLLKDTANGKGDTEERKEHIKNLLNFFPVIGEDEDGEMIALDAEKVLSIPRKIKSKEVVRMGFQSNFLFQNISNVFNAPQEVLDIIENFQPISEAKAKPVEITPDTGKDLSLNDKGEVELDEGYVIGKAADVFGAKIYENTPALDTALQTLTDAPAKEEHLEPLKKSITKEIIAPMVEQAKQEYGRDLKLSDQKRFESSAKAKMDAAVNKVVDNYRIDQNQLENQRAEQLKTCTTAQQRQEVNRDFDAQQQQSTAALMETLQSTIQQTAQEMQQTIVRTVETNQKEQEKKGYEDTVRDHLRGFSRTIPSFLMAYGDENVTLANFDQIIPDKVFQEVTSITLEQFRFLRDGGPYINQTTGQEEHFAGHLFDPVVFDDSVKEFLNLKVKLADYFDESKTEDIFDYIPPQKTNQIFTPKWVVKKMVDLLEQENPGCFDDPDKTFLDPYMKSGLYITEIVKRLYRSEKIRQRFPDDHARLEHIFAKQVYGLAPTEIIYRIVISYILGFAKEHPITKHHIRQADTLEFAKAGTMEGELDRIFKD